MQAKYLVEGAIAQICLPADMLTQVASTMRVKRAYSHATGSCRSSSFPTLRIR